MEQWRNINDNYQVSNLGNVLSLNYKRSGKAKLLKPQLNSDGRPIVFINRNCIKIHIEVAKAFCNWFDGCDVHHINFDKTDNRAENLVCLTHSEHQKLHSMYRESKPHTEEHKRKIKEHSHSKKVAEYDLDGNLIKIWDCMNDAQKFYNLMHIYEVCSGKRKSCGNRIWRYIDD